MNSPKNLEIKNLSIQFSFKLVQIIHAELEASIEGPGAYRPIGPGGKKRLGSSLPYMPFPKK